MKKITLLSVIFVFALSQVIMAVPPIKFDLTVYLGLAKYAGMGNSAVESGSTPFDGEGPYNMNLRVDSFSGGFAWDVIFLTSEKKYYGHGVSLLVDVAMMNQGFGSAIMTDEQTGDFTSTPVDPDAIPDPDAPAPNPYQTAQLLSIINIKIAPMYRFHLTRDFSFGVGPAINIIGSAGNPNFITSDAYTNEAKGLNKYYIQPQFAKVHLSFLADIQFTKFFGNFGVTASLYGDVLLQPIAFGFGTRFGVKYRFNP